MLNASFDYYTTVDSAGRTLFCFVTPDGLQSPTLHVRPGDTLELSVTNRNPKPPPGSPTEIVSNGADRCGDVTMTITSLNVHFHGTNTSPACHSDQVVHTIINSGETFKYSVQFPANEPPGLYWYHSHVHGLSEAAVQGGASGAIIVDGIENVQPAVAGLPERVLFIRDQTPALAYQLPDAGVRPALGDDRAVMGCIAQLRSDHYSALHPCRYPNEAGTAGSCGVSQTPRPTRSSICSCNMTA